ncbi:hypothetical protein H6P81_009406 [Aristolochia fimbriata]|uniref:Late embryogenesis abundant protein LEA-2 subgroup domain-containing protein n=1 Tax=Aristolochia fimbriata TaxID=158543 RepID=A0AAV7ENH1_ARIFI|nr:hypothetical protein H6P81_009406 [Aristolochia fimbriata]
MTMAEDQEALFHSYPCAVYYVQSPSVVSHANSPDCRNPADSSSALLSPNNFPLEEETPFNDAPAAGVIVDPSRREAARFTLSRYSSSRGSNNSFLHEKKIGYDLQSQGNCETEPQTGVLVLGYGRGGGRGGGDEEEEEEEDGGDCKLGRRKHGVLSFGYSPAWYCVCFQMVWRLILSIGISLLIFFLITKPPHPRVYVKVSEIREFALGEGIDGSGVGTKMLTSNCSIDLEIDNRSKFFGLNIRPPLIDMAFGRLTLATTQGPPLYVQSDSLETFRLWVSTKNKPMYGAGRAMEDLLQSGKGLPLEIRVRLGSNIRVVWNLIRPRFNHRTECLVFLKRGYDRKHRTQAYNSTCTTIPSHP